jgi:hypothetical protein
MLANYQTQVSPTPTATADPTANWKTYINDKYKFSFKYPSTLLMEINEVDTSNYVQLIFNKSLEDSFTVKASIKYPANQSKHLLDTQPIGTKVFDSNVWSVFELTNNSGLQLEKNEVLYSIIYPDSTKTLVDQILSTFKFLGASPTPSAKACTQEAKLCPDGSYVGRTGANCEFAPCP